MSDQDDKLTGKQKAFADHYLTDGRFNGNKSAHLAGYTGGYVALGVIAFKNLRNPKIRAYIDQQLSALTMPANEVLAQLADIAGGSIEDLLDDEGRFDFKKAKAEGKLALVKKLKRKTTKDEGEEVEFELYSKLEALRDLGKYHKLFIDRIDHSGSVGTYVMTKDEWERQAAERLGAAAEHLEKFDDE